MTGRRIAAAATLALAAGGAEAGGPLLVDANGEYMTWPAGSEVQYRTDNGPLSAIVNESQARSRVNAMFQVWENVASASIGYNRAGAIQATGAFSGGDVNTVAELDAVEGSCQNGVQSPIVYDADGAIFNALGIDVESVIGFAGPCAFNPATGTFVAGEAVMNGLFLDGVNGANGNPDDLTDDEFDAVFIHEFGHFSGLDHSQVNLNCLLGPQCTADDVAGLPTMFPFLMTDAQRTLSADDVAWISRLYPATGGSGFNASYGTITGTVLFSDGASPAQAVNVIARRVGDPSVTAISGVSGNRFEFFLGNPITNPGPSGFGSNDPAHLGLYEISVPPGSYLVEVETIHDEFVDGSSVGGPIVVPMPGTAPEPIGPVTVTAGGTVSGQDIVLENTPPRFDQFEGPG